MLLLKMFVNVDIERLSEKGKERKVCERERKKEKLFIFTLIKYINF